jgi:hypothetical protein
VLKLLIRNLYFKLQDGIMSQRDKRMLTSLADREMNAFCSGIL